MSLGEVVLVFFVLLTVSGVSAQPALTVEWREGRLSVIAEGAPLSQVLGEVARRAGITVQGHEKLQMPVSVRLQALPLLDGLRSLLAPVSDYVLVEEGPAQGEPRPALALVFGRRATGLGEPDPVVAAVPGDEEATPQEEAVEESDGGFSRRLAR